MTGVDPDWLRGLPRAENHVHLEGLLSPAVIAAAAARAGVPVPTSAMRNLDEFLVLLDEQCALIDTADDLIAVAAERARTAADLGIRHTDLMVSPIHWTAWETKLPEMVAALDEGFRSVEASFDVTTGLSLSVNRQETAEQAEHYAQLVLDDPTGRLVGISVDGNESAPGAGTERFAPALARVRAAGKHVAVHSGESGGADRVAATLDVLAPDRIDHGIRCVEDPAVVARLAASGVPLAMCPTSNVRLGVAASFAEHPLPVLRAAGVRVTINTDDPLLIDVTQNSEYLGCSISFGWDEVTLAAVARTSIEVCTATEARRAELLGALDAYLAVG